MDLGNTLGMRFGLLRTRSLDHYMHHHSHLIVTCFDLTFLGRVVRRCHTLPHLYALSLKDYDWRFDYDGALLAQLRGIPDLKQMIVNAQKNDTKLQELVQLVSTGDKTDYALDESGGLMYKSRLCVPNDMDLRKKILYESHNTVFTMHPGGNKMYQDMKQS